MVARVCFSKAVLLLALTAWRPAAGITLLRGKVSSRSTSTLDFEDRELNEPDEDDSLSLFGPSLLDVIGGVAAETEAVQSGRLGVHRSDQRGDRYRALWGAEDTLSSRHAVTRTGRSGFQRAAVCVTGHVRTFALPGVSQSWVDNLMTTNPGGPVDLFFFGHLGHYGKHASSEAVDAQDEGIRNALANTNLRVKHSEITQSGSCADLANSYGHNLTDCSWNGRYLQVMWVDRCVQMVMQDTEHYDVIIRMRPDIGIFKPIPWTLMSTTKVNYMKRHVHKDEKFPPQAGEDWFFTLPRNVIYTYWGRVMEYYTHEAKEKEIQGTPDGILFRDALTKNRTDGMAFSEALSVYGSHKMPNRTNSTGNASNVSIAMNVSGRDSLLWRNFHTMPASYENESLVEHLLFPAVIVRFPEEAKNFLRVVECSRIDQEKLFRECQRVSKSGYFFPYNESFYTKNPPDVPRRVKGPPDPDA